MPHEASVMVVDDERGMRDMIELELTRCGHSVVKAVDGGEALRQLEATEFDLVISDIRMPGADGIAVLRGAKAMSPDTEVIIVTGHGEIESAIECVRSGAFDFVHKPFHLVDFLITVERALEHRRLRATAVLYQACQEMFSRQGDRPLAERIADTALHLLGADDISIMLLDANDSLRIVFSTGIPDVVRVDTRLALGERIAGRVALDRTPAVLPRALSDDPRFDGIESCGRVKSGIIYPLLCDDTLLGVINLNRVQSTRPFRKADLETAGIFAMQAALALRNERLAQQCVASERLSAIGQIAASVIHEINNPLTYMLASTELARDTLRSQTRDSRGALLLSPEVAQEMEELLADALDGANKLAGVVSDMSYLTRSRQETNELFDVSDAVRSAIRIAGPTLRQAAEVDVSLGHGLIAVGSSGRLGQVFLNLLVNASHALMGMNRDDPRISVTSRREGEHIVVDVADNGPGIAAAHLPRIMEPFYSTKSKDQGSGLGLSISRDIVEDHLGHLSVVSKSGEGATFKVCVPAAPDEESLAHGPMSRDAKCRAG